MNQTTHTARAPYQVGDHVAALSHDARYGTCLVRNARVAAVERDTQRPGCPWLVTYQAGPDQQRGLLHEQVTPTRGADQHR